MSASTPKDFRSFCRSAEFHALQLEHSLALAADRAPSSDLEDFCNGQATNVQQIRRVLPAVRDKARRA